jgi:hypothetical protein
VRIRVLVFSLLRRQDNFKQKKFNNLISEVKYRFCKQSEVDQEETGGVDTARQTPLTINVQMSLVNEEEIDQ